MIPDAALRAVGNAIRSPGQTAEDAEVQAERALVAFLSWLRSTTREAVEVRERMAVVAEDQWSADDDSGLEKQGTGLSVVAAALAVLAGDDA